MAPVSVIAGEAKQPRLGRKSRAPSSSLACFASLATTRESGFAQFNVLAAPRET